jgi:signal transduction histidine kinase
MRDTVPMPRRFTWVLARHVLAQGLMAAVVFAAIALPDLERLSPDPWLRGLFVASLVVALQSGLVHLPSHYYARSVVLRMRDRRLRAERAEAETEALRAAAEEARATAEAALETRSTFVASMSHELRTPLNGIIAVADLLQRGSTGPDQTRLIGVVRDSGETLLTLVNDILDFAKLERGRTEIEAIPFVPADLLGKAAALYRLRCEGKGLAFAIEVDPALRHSVLGDPVRIRQVLDNLASNAIKFTEKGSVRVIARLGRAESAARELVCEVRDTGIGMDEAQKARIFEPFAQADRSITRRFGGTGLGLSISETLCRLMGGRLDAESVPGEGSVFRFVVRLAAEPAACAATALPGPRPRASIVAGPGIGRRIIDMSLSALDLDYCYLSPAAAADAGWAGEFDLVMIERSGVTPARLGDLVARLRGPGREPRPPIYLLEIGSAVAEAPAPRGVDATLRLPSGRDFLARELRRLARNAASPPVQEPLETT